MQNVFGSNGLLANARFSKGNVFRNLRVKVVAYHRHIEKFVDNVLRIRVRRIR